jgi:succinyl-CoA synthetase beta subunit
MKCDIVAEGIIHAIEKVDIKVPLVVRLEGTNVEIARKKLDDSKLNIIFADSMKDASKKIVEALK